MAHLPRVLLISFTDHARDPRVHRQIQALLDEPVELFTAGTGAAAEAKRNHTLVAHRRPGFGEKLLRAAWLKTGMYERYYWNTPLVVDAWKKLQRKEFELIVANDLETLPLALRLAGKKAKVWIDAHEYTPREKEEDWRFRFFFARFWDSVCRRYLPLADYMTTVGERLSEEYESQYGVQSDVLINAPALETQCPTPTNSDSIRLVHHGGVNVLRRLDLMVEMMKHVDHRFQLDLMLVNNDTNGLKAIRKAAYGLDNVRFLEPVPMREISKRLNRYDMGLCFIWPQNFNYRYSLPNKFFEFIQARLAVAIWPSPEMRSIVDKYGIGVVVESYDPVEMARAFNELTGADIYRLKEAASRCADNYSAEKSMEMIRHAVRQLLQQPGTPVP